MPSVGSPRMRNSALSRRPRCVTQTFRHLLAGTHKIQDKFRQRALVAIEAYDHCVHHSKRAQTFEIKGMPSLIGKNEQKCVLSSTVSLAKGVDRIQLRREMGRSVSEFPGKQIFKAIFSRKICKYATHLAINVLVILSYPLISININDFS